MFMHASIPKQHCDTPLGGRSAALFFGVRILHLRFFVVAHMGLIGLLIRNSDKVNARSLASDGVTFTQ